ncbi:hypothetical protein HDU81_007913 [Chytriomyces hyalinus]|nr:hypothetical protein HDU81_007913 [Chytriomyces hyalinus]
MAYVLGPYAGTVTSSLFTAKSAHADSATPGLVSMIGKRFIYMSETEKGTQFNEALVKLLTGGDDIAVRAMYQESTTMKPQFKILMVANDLPKFRGEEYIQPFPTPAAIIFPSITTTTFSPTTFDSTTTITPVDPSANATTTTTTTTNTSNTTTSTSITPDTTILSTTPNTVLSTETTPFAPITQISSTTTSSPYTYDNVLSDNNGPSDNYVSSDNNVSVYRNGWIVTKRDIQSKKCN